MGDRRAHLSSRDVHGDEEIFHPTCPLSAQRSFAATLEFAGQVIYRSGCNSLQPLIDESEAPRVFRSLGELDPYAAGCVTSLVLVA